jgi:hypothetical protein
MHGLEIVRPQHEDDQRQRGIDFNPLFQANQPVSSFLERIVPYGAPAIQAIFDHPNGMPSLAKFGFHYARPAGLEWQALAAFPVVERR